MQGRKKSLGYWIAALTCMGATLQPLPTSPGLLAAQTASQPLVSAENGRAAVSDKWLLAGSLAGSAVFLMVDDDVRDFFRSESLQGNGGADFLAGSFSHLGGYVPVAASASLFVLGAATGTESIRDPALNVTGAILASSALTAVIKGALGRTRPSEAEEPVHEFQFGRGFREGTTFRSYPSGHTTAAFALAAAVSAETAHRWPAAHGTIRWIVYPAAALTGLSRMYHNEHWASDVLVGAGIGLVVGRTFVNWRHREAVDAVMAGLTVAPGRDRSMNLGFSLPTR